MTFSYDLTDTTKLTLSRIRLLIGDTNEGKGPRRDGRNFSDEELTDFLAQEDNRRQRAAALALETLASEWAALAGENQLGPHSQTYRQSQQFAQKAADLRQRFGYTEADSNSGFSVSIGMAS